MPKFVKAPKIIIMCQLLSVKWNHRVLLWCVVTMKYLLEELARDTARTLGNWVVTS